MSSKTVIGLDVGRSAIKLAAAWSRAGESRQHRLQFPSAVTPWFRLVSASDAERAREETVLLGDRSFFFGSTALLQGGDKMQSGLRDDWIYSDEHMALLLGALQKAQAAGVPGIDRAELVVGLPGRLYAVSFDEYMNRVSQVLPGRGVTVMPQPIGPFFSHLLDTHGREARPELMGQVWATIEIGQYTTDICLVAEGQAIQEKYASCNGMRVVAELLMRQLARSRGISDLGLPEATQIMETGHMLIGGKPVSVEDELRASIEPLAREIQETANQVLGSATLRRMHGLLVAGGGAQLLFHQLATSWPQALLCQEPRFSVAEGFMRAGLMRENTPAEALAD